MKKVNAIMIVGLIVAVSAISITSSKYIYNSIWGYYLKSQDFYFESDLLDLNIKNNSMLKWDGSNIEFLLKNNENSELISDFDISYKVTCEVLGEESKYATCLLNDKNESTFDGVLSSESKCINKHDDIDVTKFTKTECEIGGYEWIKEPALKQISFNVGLIDQTKSIDEVSVKVIVESTKPYKKVLTGVFNLNRVEVEESEYVINHNKFELFDEIAIINKINLDKCFSINYDTKKYLIDSENNNIVKFNTDKQGNINKIEIKVNKKSSSILKFYKINSELEYDIADFKIEEIDCLEN